MHNGKEHGIILDTVPTDVKLVIVPDAGSMDLEEHKALHDKGIDTLVLDHHVVTELSQYACIINNQIFDYPNPTLSGVGVVYKFCSYIDKILGKKDADNYLDLVALGMIADMMSLKNFETKRLIERGLENVQNPFFEAMVEKQSYSLQDEITPIGIAFYIAPYINATIRMGTNEEKLVLFESMLNYKALELIPSTKRGCSGQLETRVAQACRNCTNVKNRQTKARDKITEQIEEIIEQQDLLRYKILIIKLNKNQEVEKTLTGLIANQLMAKYMRPVLLLNELEDGFWAGSARGYGKSKMTDFRQFIEDSHLAEFAEGHNSAFGVCFTSENLDKFIKYCETELKDFDFSSSYKVDFIYDSNTFNTTDIIEIASMKPLWGQEIEEALVAIEGIKVSKDNLFLMAKDRNPTLKIILPNGTSVIKFKSSQEEYDKLYSELGCTTINIVGKCEQNKWNGTITPQILVDDYEIVGEVKYYF